MANSKLYPTLSPASTQARTPTGANAADCRSGGHPPVGPTPYHCEACGASSPYVGRKPKARCGNACRQCSQVERAIHDAQATAYREAVADAYRNGCHGDEKRAIIAGATRVASEAWRAAQLGFGIGVGAAQAAADVEPAGLAPRPTRVEVRYASPMDFGVFASGGTFEDLHGAIVQQMRAMAEAGLVGPGELTAVGTSLLDTAQDMALAAAWDAAQVAALDGGCPACGSTLITVFDIEGKRSYVCRSCGARWT